MSDQVVPKSQEQFDLFVCGLVGRLLNTWHVLCITFAKPDPTTDLKITGLWIECLRVKPPDVEASPLNQSQNKRTCDPLLTRFLIMINWVNYGRCSQL